MYNFGKIPPRAIQGSGVASVLGEDCRVFYDNLFNSAGIGRVSDLLSARLKAFKLDELKLRAVLLFSFFEAYREESIGGALDEPLVIECGMDDEKVAVGVSFCLKNAADFKTDGLNERISQNRASNAFEALIGMIYLNSDHTIIRMDLAQGRVEIISLLAIPEKIELSERQPMTIVEQGNAVPVEQVKAKEYVQLADLEYAELLKEDSQKAKKKVTFSTGEILSKKFSAGGTGNSKTLVKDNAEDDNSSEVRIAGDAHSSEVEMVHISVGQQEDSKNSLVRVSGTNPPENESEGFSVQAMLKKVWPFKRKKPEKAGSEENSPSELATPATEVPAVSMDVVASAEPNQAEAEPETQDEDDPKVIAQHLSQNFVSGSFSQFVERTQEMAHEIKRDSQDQAAKRWADGLSQQIMAEKIRLGALSQKINQAIRQKEQDLKKREQRFAEDLRRKEEALHQKNTALSRAKEQVAQLTAQLEKQKGIKSSAGEEAGLKHKYLLSQRMIMNMREENAKLTDRLDELKSLSTSAQKTNESAAQIELTSLKSKQDQMTRQNMQLKSLNEQLMRRISQSSAKASEKNERSAVDEMKKKYDSASKMSEQQQKELTLLKAKLDKLSKEETRLTTDLSKREAELRRAKAELEQLQSQMKTEKKPEKKAG